MAQLADHHCQPDGTVKTNLLGQLSNSGDALITTTYNADGTTKGLGFLFEKNISIGTGATVYVLFNYTTYTSGNGIVYILPPFFHTTSGPVTVNLYRDTNYTGGTPFPAINPNTLAAKTTAETTLTIGPTGTVKGTLALEYLVGGASQGNQSAPGDATGISFFIRDNTKKSLVEIVNNSGASITFHYGQMLFEI